MKGFPPAVRRRAGLAASGGAPPEKADARRRKTELLINNALYIVLFFYIIAVTVYAPRFVSPESAVNILINSAFRLPIALGVGGIIVLTGTDLSAGRIVGLTACVTASLLQRADYPDKMFPDLPEVNIFLALLLVMALGAAIGAFNGYFVARFRLHSFIVTLATALIVYAGTLWYIKQGENGGKPIGGLRFDFSSGIVGSADMMGVRIQFIVFYAAALTALMWFIWNKTVLGKNMFAVGCSPEAAHVSGISVAGTTVAVFAIAGALYGINGFFSSAFIGSNNAATGFNFELDAIAACVIGGVSFSGGVGRIRGIVAGVALLQVITSSFIFLGVDGNLQYAIKGIVILAACAIDMRKYVVKR